MTLTVMVILLLGAAICTGLGAAGKMPWYVPVGLLCIYLMLLQFPKG